MSNKLINLIDVDNKGYLDQYDFSTMVFRASSHNKKFKKFADLACQLRVDDNQQLNVD